MTKVFSVLHNVMADVRTTGSPAIGHGAEIVKEGWLFKRGEHIRTWRSRYFILFVNGSLVGFKTQPEKNNYNDPLHNFTVKGSGVMPIDRPKPYAFIIRGLQWTTVIERRFHVENDSEREEWVEAIRFVVNKLIMNDLEQSGSSSGNCDVDMGTIADDDMISKLSMQGTSMGKTDGKGRVVWRLEFYDEGRKSMGWNIAAESSSTSF